MVKIHRAAPPSGSGPADFQTAFTYADQQITRRSYSAYLGLVRNGSGVLGSNDNFSRFEFVPDDLVAGGGSFRRAGDRAAYVVYPDDRVAVDPSRPLRLSLNAKAAGADVPNFYAGLAAFDLDDLAIESPHWMYNAGTTTTLTADLKTGDTEIKVASTAGWTASGDGPYAGYSRGVIVWGYRNSRDYLYPPHTYSRYALSDSNGAYAAGGLTGTTITLTAPWPHPTLPAGTPISNGLAGSVYTYLGAIGDTLKNQWQPFEGRSVGLGDGSNRQPASLPPGTAFVRPMIVSYGGTAAYLINMLQLSEVIS